MRRTTLLLTLLVALGGCHRASAPQRRDPAVGPVSDAGEVRRPAVTRPLPRAVARPAMARPVMRPAVQGIRLQDPWWLKRHALLCARVGKGRVDLLMIGDSITHFWESDGKAVWRRYYAKRRAVNLGISGDTTENVLWRVENGEVAGISPKVAVLMIGTNNAAMGDKPQRIAAGIKAILGALRPRLPRAKILLLAIFPRGENDKDELRQVNQAVNRIIAGYADNRSVFYLDINKRFLTANRTLGEDLLPDLLHPNAKGYLVWAQAMEPTLRRLMGER